MDAVPPLPTGYETDVVSRVEANIDDLSPELVAPLIDLLLAAGALDAWFTPIQMKKQRPGTLLSALCEKERLESVSSVFFRETTTFGIRIDEVTRLKLERHFESVATEYGEISMKVGVRHGKIVQASPEFESCRTAGERTGQPIREIYAAAQQAFAEIRRASDR